MKPFSVFIFVLLLINPIWALEISKTFSTTQDQSNTELIWNTLDEILLPPIHVRNYVDGLGVKNLDIDPGDGRHGNFSTSTYSQFSVDNNVSGNLITIDTDAFPSLQFKNFNLASGWTIRPRGSRPLVIKVLGDMAIYGTIDCSGGDGEDLSSDINALAEGGEGICGGGKGGNGGNILLEAVSGVNGGATVSGGQAGPSTSLLLGQGGGGGGAYGDTFGSNDPKDGDDSTGGIGGIKGNHITDDAFAEVGGGSGGGGGSVFSDGTGASSNGGGGGGGGGIIDIVVLGNISIGNTGKIFAYGGSGGGNITGLRAGGGGGGGGGSISIFAKGDIVNDGVVHAQRGLGGITNAANGGDGGDGGNGRTWISEKDVIPTGLGTIDPPSFLVTTGAVRYKIGIFTTESISFDLMNSRPRLQSATITSDLQSGSSASIEVSLSDDSNFTPLVWEGLSNLTQSPSRYFKYKLILDNQNASLPSSVSKITIDYEPFVEEEFNFTGGCGSINKTHSNSQIFIVIFLLMLPMMLVLLIKRKFYNSDPIKILGSTIDPE
ncbi:MAG: hypothetical protein H6625_13525 [Bdellovibrionaceae bacterium]|nr:hypothetical protein [Pseudobdellovibrionaceae bacterium]